MSNKLVLPSRVILEKLTVAQLAKKVLASYGSRRLITVFTRPYVEPDESSPDPHTLFTYCTVQYYSSTPRSTKWSLSFRFQLSGQLSCPTSSVNKAARLNTCTRVQYAVTFFVV